MADAPRKPRLMTPDLERYIERVHHRATAEAERRARLEAAMREAWASEGGRAFRRFVDTRPSEATRRIYAQHLEDFLLWIVRRAGGIDPLDATPEDLAAYERDVDARVSPRTGRRMALRSRQERVRTVRTAYQFCVDEDLVARSPARHLRIRGRAEPRRTFLTDEQAAALLAACEGRRPSDLRDRTLVVVLLHTGLRAAEAAGLTWDSLEDEGAPSLTVEGKGRVVRTVPLSDEAYRALVAWATASQSAREAGEPVWTRLNHRVAGDASRDLRSGSWSVTRDALTPDSVHSIVTRRAARAGLQHVTPHTLRRTFATKLRDLGVAVDTISRYLGHASILTTVAYFSPRDELATKAVRRLRYGSD
jgi:site-specific recombinase XerD